MTQRRAPALFLLRHADAGDRESFVGDDLTRPLSEKGRRQAASIAERLAPVGLASLVSSPALRCTETLAPLAALSGLALEEIDLLVEGADPDKALHFLLELEPRPGAAIVACSHGDVLGSIVATLLGRELAYEGSPKLQKGATVEVSFEDDRPAHLRFVSGR